MKLKVVTLPVCDIDRARYRMLLGNSLGRSPNLLYRSRHSTSGSFRSASTTDTTTTPTWLPSRPAFDGTGRIVNFSDAASIDPHRVDAVIAGHKDAEMIGLEGVFGRARSVTSTLKKHWHQSVTGWSVHNQACRTHTDQPFLWCPAGQADVQRSTPDRRLRACPGGCLAVRYRLAQRWVHLAA